MKFRAQVIEMLCGMRTNDIGRPVSAGMYIYTIQAGDFITKSQDGINEIDIKA